MVGRLSPRKLVPHQLFYIPRLILANGNLRACAAPTVRAYTVCRAYGAVLRARERALPLASRTPQTAAFDGLTVRHHSAVSRAADSRSCSARWLYAFAFTAHPLTSPMQRTVLARYGFVRTTVVPPVSQTNHLAPLLRSRGRGAPLATACSRPWRQSACCRLP